MEARRHPSKRLDRKFPGERLHEPRGLSRTLLERGDRVREIKTVVGEDLATREGETRDTQRVIDAGPNAPLLKRLILFPYGLETEPGQRAHVRDIRPWGSLEREITPSAGAEAREARGAITEGNPLKQLAIFRKEKRERLSVDDWLSGGKR